MLLREYSISSLVFVWLKNRLTLRKALARRPFLPWQANRLAHWGYISSQRDFLLTRLLADSWSTVEILAQHCPSASLLTSLLALLQMPRLLLLKREF